MRGVRLIDVRTEYLDHLKNRNLAANSIRCNQSMLAALIRVLGADYYTSQIQPSDIDRVLKESNWGPKTKATNLAFMKQLFAWCRTRRYMRADQDPLMGGFLIRGAQNRGEDRDKLWLWRHEGDWDLVLDAAGRMHPRDRAVIALGLYLMPRIEELADIRWGDVDFENHSVYLGRSKTRDGDRMPLVTELASELATWKTFYETVHGPVEDHWFVVPAFGHAPRRASDGRYGIDHSTDFHPTRLASHPYEVVKRALTATGKWTNEQLYWTGGHTLRRSGARGLYDSLRDQGIDNALRLVQTWLGHSSVLHTQRYIGINADREMRNKIFAGRSMFGNVGPDIHAVRGGSDGESEGTNLRQLRLVRGDNLDGWPQRSPAVGD